MSPIRTFQFVYTSEGVRRVLVQFQTRDERCELENIEVGGKDFKIGVITHKALDCQNDERIYHIHISSDVRNATAELMTHVNAENISWVSTIRLKGPITPERKKIMGTISLVEV